MTMVWHADCIHFRGDIPCRPHKDHGVHCDGCSHYRRRRGRILIIKLGATGDVLRTTPLLEALAERYPDHEVWWVTLTPEVLPSRVHVRLRFDHQSILTIAETSFDIAINLDKDPPACALMAKVRAEERFGYTWVNGRPAPVDERSVGKFLTGLFDDVNKSNTLSYPEEILGICGFPWKGQEYVMDEPGPSPLTLPEGRGGVVGLNTGCGERWLAREWPLEYWERLIGLLQEAGFRVILLGGPTEHERNLGLKARTGAIYEGTYPYRDFFAVVRQCDVVVTAVTMALHAAIGLRRRVVLFNNIFNPNEFELYGRGILLQPPVPCHCYFKHQCTHDAYSCMELLEPETVAHAVAAQWREVSARS